MFLIAVRDKITESHCAYPRSKYKPCGSLGIFRDFDKLNIVGGNLKKSNFNQLL